MSNLEAGTNFDVSDDFNVGYDDAWADFDPDEPVGHPVACDDYIFGWWCGIGDARAFYDGWQAYDQGVKFCPYAIGNEDECFREQWLNGYWEAWVVAP
ncbi:MULTISPECIES: hypothetical protein [Methylobacter]